MSIKFPTSISSTKQNSFYSPKKGETAVVPQIPSGSLSPSSSKLEGPTKRQKLDSSQVVKVTGQFSKIVPLQLSLCQALDQPSTPPTSIFDFLPSSSFSSSFKLSSIGSKVFDEFDEVLLGLDEGHGGSEDYLSSIETPEETQARLEGLTKIGEGFFSVAYLDEDSNQVYKYTKLYEIVNKEALKRTRQDVEKLLGNIELNYIALSQKDLPIAPILNVRKNAEGKFVEGGLVEDMHSCSPYLPYELTGEYLLEPSIQKQLKKLIDYSYSENAINIDFNIDNIRVSLEGEAFLIDVDNEEINGSLDQRLSLQKFIKHACKRVASVRDDEIAIGLVKDLIQDLPKEVKEGCLYSVAECSSDFEDF